MLTVIPLPFNQFLENDEVISNTSGLERRLGDRELLAHPAGGRGGRAESWLKPWWTHPKARAVSQPIKSGLGLWAAGGLPFPGEHPQF